MDSVVSHDSIFEYACILIIHLHYNWFILGIPATTLYWGVVGPHDKFWIITSMRVVSTSFELENNNICSIDDCEQETSTNHIRNLNPVSSFFFYYVLVLSDGKYIKIDQLLIRISQQLCNTFGLYMYA